MERVYLGDWLYNAGIIGFLKINHHLWKIEREKLISQDESLLKFGDNYLEFDRKIFEGFSERFFDYAFRQYLNYFAHRQKIQQLSSYLEQLKSSFSKNERKQIKEIWKEILDLLKNSIDIEKKYMFPQKLPKTIKSFEEANGIIESVVYYFENLPYEVQNKKAIDWFRFGKFFHRNWLNSISLENFKDKYENSIINQDFSPETRKINKESVKLYCLNCYPLRLAKKGTAFSTSISSFAGLNADLINFVYLEPFKKPKDKIKLPLCEICEIIYFSYFAGLIPVNRNGKTVFYYVNSDTSLESLLKENLLPERKLTKEISENPFIEFFTELVLMSEEERARYTLQNTVIIELDLNNETMPKIYSFNISREKAEFLVNNKENFQKLSKVFYKIKIKNDSFSVLPEVIEKTLNNSLNFKYLNRLVKLHLQNANDSSYYATNITSYQLQLLNLITKEFLQKVILGGTDMGIDENNLWSIYYQGIDLAKKLRESNAENKIQSIAYKLLNALRIGDTNQFMDVLIRTYMAYGEEIPSTFVKAISDKNTFYPLGYSFLNGLLGKEKPKEVSNNE